MSGPDWVKKRANCTISDNMMELVRRLKGDVQSFNGLESRHRGKRKFQADFNNGDFVIKRMVEVENEHRQTFVIEDSEYENDVVIVRCTETTIFVSRNGKMNFEITPHWNSDTQACDLLIDDEVYPPWKVSEKILGDFMFVG